MPKSDEELQQEMLEAVDILVNGRIEKLKYNYYITGKVSEVDNVKKEYVVNINGNYHTLKARQGLVVNVNDSVYICVVNNDFSDKFIDNVIKQSDNSDDILKKVEELNEEIKKIISSTIVDKEKLEQKLSELKTLIANTSKVANDTKQNIENVLEDSYVSDEEKERLEELKNRLIIQYEYIAVLVDEIKDNEKLSSEKREALVSLLDNLNKSKNKIIEKIVEVQSEQLTINLKNLVDEDISQFVDLIAKIESVLNESITDISMYSIEELKEYVDIDFKEGILLEEELVRFRKLLGDYRAELSSLNSVLTYSYKNENNTNFNKLKSLGLDLDIFILRLLDLENRLKDSNEIFSEDKDLLDQAFKRIIDINEAISMYLDEEANNIVERAIEIENTVVDLQDRFSREIKARELLSEQVAGMEVEFKEDISNARNEITGLAGSLSDFEKEIYGSFKEGVLSEAEIDVLNKQILILDNEKANFDKRYELVINNELLKGLAKDDLSKAYTNFNNAYEQLISDIALFSLDGNITVEESNQVELDFVKYKESIIEFIEKLKIVENLISDEKINKVESEISSKIEQTESNIMLEVNKRTTEEQVGALINIESDSIVQSVSKDIKRLEEEMSSRSILKNGNFSGNEYWTGSGLREDEKPLLKQDLSKPNDNGVTQVVTILKSGTYSIAINGVISDEDFMPRVVIKGKSRDNKEVIYISDDVLSFYPNEEYTYRTKIYLEEDLSVAEVVLTNNYGETNNTSSMIVNWIRIVKTSQIGTEWIDDDNYELYQRMSSAEQKITADAIISTVTGSKEYIDEVTGKVNIKDIINTINVSTEGIRISADKIAIDGVVTFSDLEGKGKTTVIDGSLITAGTINADLIKTGTLDVNVLKLNGIDVKDRWKDSTFKIDDDGNVTIKGDIVASNITGSTLTGSTLISEGLTDRVASSDTTEKRLRRVKIENGRLSIYHPETSNITPVMTVSVEREQFYGDGTHPVGYINMAGLILTGRGDTLWANGKKVLLDGDVSSPNMSNYYTKTQVDTEINNRSRLAQFG